MPRGQMCCVIPVSYTHLEVGAFLWEKLMEGTTEEDLVQDVTKQYEVGTEKAAGDVKKFLEKLKSQGLLED